MFSAWFLFQPLCCFIYLCGVESGLLNRVSKRRLTSNNLQVEKRFALHLNPPEAPALIRGQGEKEPARLSVFCCGWWGCWESIPCKSGCQWHHQRALGTLRASIPGCCGHGAGSQICAGRGEMGEQGIPSGWGWGRGGRCPGSVPASPWSSRSSTSRLERRDGRAASPSASTPVLSRHGKVWCLQTLCREMRGCRCPPCFGADRG